MNLIQQIHIMVAKTKGEKSAYFERQFHIKEKKV